jgi:hypothetical protein
VGERRLSKAQIEALKWYTLPRRERIVGERPRLSTRASLADRKLTTGPFIQDDLTPAGRVALALAEARR